MSKFIDDVKQYLIEGLKDFNLQYYTESELIDMKQEPYLLASYAIQTEYDPEVSPHIFLRYNMCKYNDEELAESYLKENLMDIVDYFSSRERMAPNVYVSASRPEIYLFDAVYNAATCILVDVLSARSNGNESLTQKDIDVIIRYLEMSFDRTSSSYQEKMPASQIREKFDTFLYSLEQDGATPKDIKKVLGDLAKGRSENIR